jgi:hypothetical protein
MFCIRCGKEIDAGASFCGHCGAKTENTAGPSNAAGLAGFGQPAAKTGLNIAGVSGRPVQFYVSFILSGLITVGFFFKWLEILGQGLLSFFGAASQGGYNVLGAIGAVVDLMGTVGDLGAGVNIWLILVILLLVAQCLIPIMNIKYCYDLCKVQYRAGSSGKMASTASVLLSALFIAVILVGNAYIASESGGWIKEAFRIKGAPYFILCAALVNRCVIIPSLVKLINGGRG